MYIAPKMTFDWGQRMACVRQVRGHLGAGGGGGGGEESSGCHEN